MTVTSIASNIFRPLVSSIRHLSLLRGFIGKEVRGQFAGTMAGMLWALMNPLVTILIYMFVFSVVIRVAVTVEETGTDSFFIYFVTGFVPWLIFSSGLTRATGSLLDNASLITKVIFPVELIPVTSVLSSLIINGIGFIILIVFLSFESFLAFSWLLMAAVLPLQILFTLGLAMFFSATCVFIRDLREMSGLIIMVWFFLTPIIYPISLVPDNIRSIIELNPMYMIVSLYREVLIMNTFSLDLYLTAAVISVAVYSLGSLFFMRAKSGFGDVL